MNPKLNMVERPIVRNIKYPNFMKNVITAKNIGNVASSVESEPDRMDTPVTVSASCVFSKRVWRWLSLYESAKWTVKSCG